MKFIKLSRKVRYFLLAYTLGVLFFNCILNLTMNIWLGSSISGLIDIRMF